MEIINDLIFISYLALYDMYEPSGKKYLTQKGETIIASSDKEAVERAINKSGELTKKDKGGVLYILSVIKKSETHHRLLYIYPAST